MPFAQRLDYTVFVFAKGLYGQHGWALLRNSYI